MSKTTCQNPAAYRYTWPGEDETTICMIHAIALANVAQAIGLHLQVIPLTTEDFLKEPMPACTQLVDREAP